MQSRQSHRALVLFTSHPGKEVQRKNVAGNLSDAMRLYRTFLQHILTNVYHAQQTCDFDVIIASDAHDYTNLIDVHQGLAQNGGFRFLVHKGRYFGEKFHSVLDRVFEGGYQEAIVIGNDCLDLSASGLKTAFQELEKRELVIGPSVDGGFYLLGLKANASGILDGVPWCCNTVFETICSNATARQYRIGLLTLLGDIDSYNDFRLWLQKNIRSGRQLPWLLVGFLKEQIIPHTFYPPISLGVESAREVWQLPPPARCFAS